MKTQTTKKRLTIYDIKLATCFSSPHFFDRKTLKFFGQTMKDFKVRNIDGKTYIIAPMYDRQGRNVGTTSRRYEETGINCGVLHPLTEEEKRQVIGVKELI